MAQARRVAGTQVGASIRRLESSRRCDIIKFAHFSVDIYANFTLVIVSGLFLRGLGSVGPLSAQILSFETFRS